MPRSSRLQGTPAAGQLHVIAFRDAIDAHVQIGSPGGPAAHFLAQEEVRIVAKTLDRVNRVMIGNGDQIHAALLE